MAKKNKSKDRGRGRPAIWTDPEVLEKLVDNYFESETRPTLAGLAYALGISRSTLYEYEAKDEFSDTIKKARRRIEKIYEELLVYTATHPTGVIFSLKNMGWTDKTETDLTSKGEKLSIGIITYDKVKKVKKKNAK